MDKDKQFQMQLRFSNRPGTVDNHFRGAEDDLFEKGTVIDSQRADLFGFVETFCRGPSRFDEPRKSC